MASKPKKLSLEEVLQLVEQLPADQQERLRLQLNGNAESQSASGTEPHPFLDWHIDINALATQQGVPESTTVASLKGDFWPAEEDMDEFIATLREWRRESSGRK
jgi:hypothetical protein